MVVTAEVRWLTPNQERLVPGAGLEFTDLPVPTRLRLQSFLGRTGLSENSTEEKKVRLLLLEAHPLMREVFKFEISRLGESRGWHMEIVSSELGDEYRGIISGSGFHAAIIDLDEFQDRARQLIADLRNSPLQRSTTVVLLSTHPVPELDDLKADVLFLRKPVSIQSLRGILGLVGDQQLQGVARRESPTHRPDSRG